MLRSLRVRQQGLHFPPKSLVTGTGLGEERGPFDLAAIERLEAEALDVLVTGRGHFAGHSMRSRGAATDFLPCVRRARSGGCFVLSLPNLSSDRHSGVNRGSGLECSPMNLRRLEETHVEIHSA